MKVEEENMPIKENFAAENRMFFPFPQQETEQEFKKREKSD